MSRHDDIDAALDAEYEASRPKARPAPIRTEAEFEAARAQAQTPEDLWRALGADPEGRVQASPGGYTVSPPKVSPPNWEAMEGHGVESEPAWIEDDVDRTFHRLHPEIDPLATEVPGDKSGSIPPSDMDAFMAAFTGAEASPEGEAVFTTDGPKVNDREARVRELVGQMTGRIKETPVETEEDDPWANSPERRPHPGVLLYFFSEDHGDREDCSIFYARNIVVLTPAGGKKQVEAALDTILKCRTVPVRGYRTAGSPTTFREPDWNDPQVADMVGPGGNINLLVAELAKVGITAFKPDQSEYIESS